jgi:hypothetical protein
MPAALLILVLLIGATPIVVALDGPIVQGLVAAGAATGAAAVAWGLRPGEGGYLLTLVRPMAAVAAVPALWMAMQTLPLEALGLAHPIWQSAAAALGKPVGGSISIDAGATLIALCRYLSAAAVALVAAAVAVDRQRAERMLFALVAATGVIAAATIAHDVAGLRLLGAAARAAATGCAALGTILATAGAIRTFERHETRRADPNASLAAFAPTLAACFAAFAACAAAVVWSGTGETIFSAAYGLATMIAVVAIRRLGLGPWGYGAIAAAAVVVAAAIIASRPGLRTQDLTLAFATQVPPARVSEVQSMLADAPWAGSGAGTFAALLPIYRDFADTMPAGEAPTAAAAIAIELGRPMLWAIVLAAAGAIVLLLRGALQRGRDSFYPAAGAASLVTLLLLAFGEAAVLATGVAVIAASVLGLAAAQSRSRATSNQ